MKNIIYILLIISLGCFTKERKATKTDKETTSMLFFLDTVNTYQDPKLMSYVDSLRHLIIENRFKLVDSELSKMEIEKIMNDLRGKVRNVQFMNEVLELEHVRALKEKDSVIEIRDNEIVRRVIQNSAMKSSLERQARLRIARLQITPYRFRKGLLSDSWVQESKAIKVDKLVVEFDIQANGLAIRGKKVVTLLVESLESRTEKSVSKEIIYTGDNTPVLIEYVPTMPFKRGKRNITVIVQGEDEKKHYLILE